MTAKPPFQHRLRIRQLNPRGATAFDLRPDTAARAAIADDLGLLDLPDLRFEGRITPERNDSWLLTGELSGRVVQPCIVTLEPVESTIADEVRRVFSPHVATPEAELAEMPDDDIEPLGDAIDVGEVMVEALSLALPLYPRADGAVLDEGNATPDGVQPVEEADGDTRKPFAGLGEMLRKRD